MQPEKLNCESLGNSDFQSLISKLKNYLPASQGHVCRQGIRLFWQTKWSISFAFFSLEICCTITHNVFCLLTELWKHVLFVLLQYWPTKQKAIWGSFHYRSRQESCHRPAGTMVGNEHQLHVWWCRDKETWKTTLERCYWLVIINVYILILLSHFEVVKYTNTLLPRLIQYSG